MILTLLVIPALYSLWHEMLLRAEARAAQSDMNGGVAAPIEAGD